MRLIHAGQALALAAALLAGPFTAASAADTAAARPEKLAAKFTATLVARHSGKCLDVAGVSTADGANVQQWTCLPNQRNQEWNLVATDSGYYTLRAVHSGKCLDVAGVGTADGANVQQWTCLSNQRNQEWRLVQKDNGYFTLVVRHSGKCLDVAGVGTADGANVQQWTCLPNQRNQEWRLA
ncbi:RICIN domain-containing protein [Streptosporangium sp. NBC_01756]|uniref:RICIN domain-containing protein n=1 Tax=Streptosporangium sp. NBC_01756 TaxID=2975950 RepID=UPI002DDBEC31|nr:RICIN domain-containing protein [Streptosporangium sp. NBC_01756]WSC85198.1 RICIN domain-containing protein [Streptosporangium sp. NBC_01756]